MIHDAETYREEFFPFTCDPSALVQALSVRGLADNYFVYCDDTTNEVRIGCNALARVIVTPREVKLVAPQLAVRSSEPTRDPFAQVEAALALLPLRSWTSYGYVAFDLARFYFDYALAIAQPLLDLMIPETELRIGPNGTYLRSTRDARAAVFAALEAGPTSRSSRASFAGADPGDGAAYMAGVTAIVDAIRRGELQKAVVARSVNIAGQLDPITTLAASRGSSGAPRPYCFRFDDVRAVGFSPEILLRASGGTVMTNPLAGTRSRGATPDEDAALRSELFADSKEVKEHALSVHLIQDELRSVCLPESVRVHEFMAVKRLRYVQHLSSRVSGMLAPGRSTWNALRALFPGVTVSGIDKAAALQAIARVESGPRGLYAGAVGWIDSAGKADLAIAIRSAFQYGGSVRVDAGAGIVAESVPAREHIESVHKMKSMLSHLVQEPT